LTKKQKREFSFFSGKQAKINVLIFLIFSCISAILSTTGWELSVVSRAPQRPQSVDKEAKTGFFLL
jgi:hypothetical protein